MRLGVLVPLYMPLLRLLCPALLLFVISSWLSAQDVIVSQPKAFIHDTEAPSELPVLKKQVKLGYPAEMEKSQHGYVLVFQLVDTEGKRLNRHLRSTHKAFENEADQAIVKLKYAPAKNAGSAVPSRSWIALIYNPKSARENAKTAEPRVLAVAPVELTKKQMGSRKRPFEVWGRIRIDAEGKPTGFVFDKMEEDAEFRAQVMESLQAWRFAPARTSGQAVEGELHLPVAFIPPWLPPLTADKIEQPKPSKQTRPIFPRSMRSSGMKGEVLLSFEVDEQGKVINPVVKRSNNPAFDGPAIDALLEWKFKPGTKNGVPVKTRMAVPIFFEFQGAIDGGEDFSKVSPSEQRRQSDLPEELRYDVQPKPKGVLNPVYPFELARDGVEGKAKIVMQIGANGRIIRTRVVEATHPEFGLALIAAAESFEFEPALRDNKPCESLLTFELRFVEWSGAAGTVSLGNESSDLLRLEKKKPQSFVPGKELDAPLKPISRRAPGFPPSAKVAEGEAIIEVVVTKEGLVRLPRIVSATDPAFGYAAMQAAIHWRFEEPLSKGKAVNTHAQIPFRFTVKGK